MVSEPETLIEPLSAASGVEVAVVASPVLEPLQPVSAIAPNASSVSADRATLFETFTSKLPFVVLHSGGEPTARRGELYVR